MRRLWVWLTPWWNQRRFNRVIDANRDQLLDPIIDDIYRPNILFERFKRHSPAR